MRNSSRILSFAFLDVIICSVLLPVFGLQDNMIISSHGTVNYSNSVEGKINGIWVNYGNWYGNPTQFNSRMTSGKITHVYLNTAHWDGQILVYGRSDAEINDFITSVKNANPTIKVFAWIWSNPGITGPGYAAPDLSTYSKREQAIDSVIVAVNKGFDGIQDDTEYWTTYPTWSHQTAYFNQEQIRLDAVNKDLHAFNVPYQNQMAYMYVDYQKMGFAMQYSDPWSYANLDYMIDTYDPIATSPYLLKLSASDPNYNHPDLDGLLDTVDLFLANHGGWSNYPKWRGFTLYWYNSMDNADWNAWSNWATKG